MFWVRYLATLAVGTAVVWFLAPKAGAILRERLAEGKAFESDGGEGDDPSVGGDAPTETPLVFANEDVAVAGGFAPVRSVSAGDTASQNAPVEGGEEFRPLSVEKIFQSSGDVVLWGVVARNSAAYRKDGKKLPSPAPGGTLVEITKTTFTDKGAEMALCVLWDARRRRWAGPALIPADNIAMFDGTRDGLAAEDVDRLMEFCSLSAALAERKEELDRAEVERNPHAARLREIEAERKRLAARTKELTAQRDSLTGAARNRVADELRAMEATATEISMAAQRELALYEDWKNANPPGTIDYMRDPEYRELKTKLRAALPGVAMFGLSKGFGVGDGE